MVSYRTPLGRARGLGSAKHGVSQWISERVSSVALVFLCLWLIRSGFVLAKADYATATYWVQSPLNAVLLVLLLAVGFWHMHAGMRVVVEDYIHTALSKAGILMLNLFVCALGGALAVFCVLKIALGAGVY
jgi:succinate dehydrogenase / fumarate reductase membrane anchor subunit